MKAFIAMDLKMSLTNEFKMAIALLEVPVSVCKSIPHHKVAVYNRIYTGTRSFA